MYIIFCIKTKLSLLPVTCVCEEKPQVLIKMSVIIIPTLINPPVIPPERKYLDFSLLHRKAIPVYLVIL